MITPVFFGHIDTPLLPLPAEIAQGSPRFAVLSIVPTKKIPIQTYTHPQRTPTQGNGMGATVDPDTYIAVHHTAYTLIEEWWVMEAHLVALGVCAQNTRNDKMPHAVLTRDAIGWITPTTHHPLTLDIAGLADRAWPLRWLRPPASAHDALAARTRLKADLAHLCAVLTGFRRLKPARIHDAP